MDGVQESLEAEPGECTRPVFRLKATPRAGQLAAIGRHERAVIVFSGVPPSDVAATLDALRNTECTSIIEADRIEDFQELVDADRVFYLSRGTLSERDLHALIHGVQAVSLDHYLRADHLRRLALAESVAGLADALRAIATTAVNASSARCVLYDRERKVLWIPRETDGESAAVGLVSFIQRSGVGLCLKRAGDDPRFDLDLDGEPSERFLGVPVRTGGGVMAVLVAHRTPPQPPFEPADVAAMEAIAAHASLYAAAWLIDEPNEGPFRARALRELEHPSAAAAEPLRLEPAWMRRASWFAIATFLVILAALFIAGVKP